MSERQRNHRGKAMPMIDPEVFRPANMAAELKRLEMVPAPREECWCTRCRRKSGMLFEPIVHGGDGTVGEDERLCGVCLEIRTLDHNKRLKGGLD